jgi:transposase
MKPIILRLTRHEKRRLQRWIRKTKDAGERVRAMMILSYGEGKRTKEIAEAVRYDVSGVRKVRQRYLQEGEAALLDRRSENGQAKVDEDLLEALRVVLAQTPDQYGIDRPTWTQRALAHALDQETWISVSEPTISRMLGKIGARWGMPKPFVACPWRKARRRRCLREIAELLENVPENEAVFYEDEVDIDLNPRIGRDWMLPGTQRLVQTPGKNEKHYLAGALNAKTGKVHWVGNGRKNGYLFVLLLRHLSQAYPKAQKIHLILDNYGIHKSHFVLNALAREFGGRIVLHFLPPYCPDENRIERLWADLHANVTRNHRCRTLKELLRNVDRFLARASPWPSRLAPELRRAA